VDARDGAQLEVRVLGGGFSKFDAEGLYRSSLNAPRRAALPEAAREKG